MGYVEDLEIFSAQPHSGVGLSPTFRPEMASIMTILVLGQIQKGLPGFLPYQIWMKMPGHLLGVKVLSVVRAYVVMWRCKGVRKLSVQVGSSAIFSAMKEGIDIHSQHEVVSGRVRDIEDAPGIQLDSLPGNPDSSRPASPSVSEQTRHQPTISSSASESIQDAWIVQLDNGKESDKFAAYLGENNDELGQLYQSIRLEHGFAIRSAFACFVVNLCPRQGDWSRLKHEHSAKISLTEQSIHIDRLVPAAAPSERKKTGLRHVFRETLNGRSETIPLNKSLSWAMKQFSESLTRERGPHFRLLLLARKSSVATQTFSYWRTLRDMFGRSTESRSMIPFKLVTHALVWKGIWTCLEREEHAQTRSMLPIDLKMALPSRESVHHYRWTFNWPRSMPSSSRASLYIWRSYKQPVEFESVDIDATRDEIDNWTVNMIFDTTTGLSSLLGAIQTEFDDSGKFETGGNLNLLSMKEYNKILLILVSKTIERVKSFLTKTFLTLHEQDLAARDSPEREHYLYLVQLQDYVACMALSIHNCLNALKSINTSAMFDQQRVRLLHQDCDYLKGKLYLADKQIRKLDDRLKKLASFRQLQHTSFTNFLLALFTPMAFVTGFFGMNTVEINGSNWSLDKFWMIAIPLTIGMIVLSAIFRPLLRFTAKTAFGIGRALKIMFPWLGTILLAILVVAPAIPHLKKAFQEDMDPDSMYIVSDDNNNFGMFIIKTLLRLRFQLTNYETPVVHSLMAFGASLNLIAAVALRRRFNWFWVIWSLSTAVTAAICAGLNHLDQTGWVTFTVPYLVLLGPFWLSLIFFAILFVGLVIFGICYGLFTIVQCLTPEIGNS